LKNLYPLPPSGGIFRIKSPFEGGIKGDVGNANIMRDIQNENCCHYFSIWEYVALEILIYHGGTEITEEFHKNSKIFFVPSVSQ
jgi:hypothetical protein